MITPSSRLHDYAEEIHKTSKPDQLRGDVEKWSASAASMDGAVTVLSVSIHAPRVLAAAVHDVFADAEEWEPINPWKGTTDSDSVMAGIAYEVLLGLVADPNDDDLKTIQETVKTVLSSPRIVASECEGKAAQTSPKRKWTQAELDAAIREHITKYSKKLAKLGKQVMEGDSGATKEARTLFGRNPLSRHFCCPKAMVSKSPPWKSIAVALKLTGPTPGIGRGDKIGLDAAVDAAGEEQWRSLEAEKKAELEAEDSASPNLRYRSP